MNNREKLQSARKENKIINRRKQLFQDKIFYISEIIGLVCLITTWIFFIIYYSYYDLQKEFYRWIPASFSIITQVLFLLL